MKTLPPQQPELISARLVLRALCGEDAQQLQAIANDPKVAGKLSSMPYPYQRQDAEQFILDARTHYQEEESIDFAITERASGKLIGSIGLDLNSRDNHAAISYWLGSAYWGGGYAAEAVREVLRFGFETLELHRITGHHFHNNPASGKVLLKVGMKQEGRRVEHFFKNGEYLDIVDYGLLARDWRS